MSALHYCITSHRPAAHLFEVTLSIATPDADGAHLRLPAWIPGSYMVRDYARHVISVEATDQEGHSLSVRRATKSEWRIAPGEGAVTVTLTVYGWDLSVRGAHLDQHHAYFNGACVFPEVVGTSGTIAVTINRPVAFADATWVATSMNAVDIDSCGFGDYSVADYDELLDHPVEIAEQQCIEFVAAEVPHRFIVRGAPPIDQTRLVGDCQKICAEHHALLGTPEDLDRYTFLTYVLEKGYGGLEHRWSTSLATSRVSLPLLGCEPSAKEYRQYLGLISHEYFHLWNVRRLKPAVFSPLDMRAEVHTGLLWVFEGITSYYDDLGLVRSGVIDAETYLDLLGQNITRILRTPGRFRQTLEDSSFDAWTKFYKQDENGPNAIVSYYAKGALAALALDLTLRAQTPTTLDAVMRECWKQFYLEGDGMPERGLESVASALAGQDLSAFFDQMIRSAEDIDIAALFAPFGVRINWRAANGAADKGGLPSDGSIDVYTGLRFDATDPQRIAVVLAHSPAEHAGLSAGDRLVAVDGLKTDKTGFEALLRRHHAQDILKIHVFRRDALIDVSLTLIEAPKDSVYLSMDDSADASAKQRFENWLVSLCEVPCAGAAKANRRAARAAR